MHANHPFSNRNFRLFSPLFREFRDFDSIFNADAEKEARFVPAADVTETEKALELKLDMPGVAPEAIDVKLEGDTLTISATRQAEPAEKDHAPTWLRRERTFGVMTRSFTLPPTVDGSKPEAAYKHGVLTVTLPKREEVQPRSLKVRVES